MKYSFTRKNYYRFGIYEENKLPPRAYFVPYGSREASLTATTAGRRYNSDRVTVLSGAWEFKYYGVPFDLPRVFDTEGITFDSVHVPSTWQHTGYERSVYRNLGYEFKCKPPWIPTRREVVWNGERTGIFNSVGVYRKIVTIAGDASKSGAVGDNDFILSFLGVASCLELHVNGKYVGYSEGSHNTAEFDITSFLVAGENEVIAVVRKWCTGTYLEDQDMFRCNGIFRDVLLTVSPKTDIVDFSFVSAKSDGVYNAITKVQVKNAEGTAVSAELIFGGKVIATAVSTEGTERANLVFQGLNVKEWNAEIPTLYTLHIELKREGKLLCCVTKQVGFRTVEIRHAVYYFNGVAIKMRGVNHHDTNCKTGYCLSVSQIREELATMKAYNMNAVRTSHYPPDPVFIEIASELGLYVVDEADIETHGAYHIISHKLKWGPRYVDRVRRMVLRDRNSPCIAMWSLGNESGGYRCQDLCADAVRELSTLPVHYEGVKTTRRMAYDVVSTMYPSVSELTNAGKGRMPWRNPKWKRVLAEKPYFMCEYAHAMGLGAGSMEDYWRTIYGHETLLGGCVWEFKDHAVYHKEGDGPYRYTYGGDHGEYAHDGSFCMDGLFYPDLKPHTGALSVKNVYRPLWAELCETGKSGTGKIRLTNHNDFRSSGYIKAVCLVLKDGEPTFKFELNADIPPHGSEEFAHDIAVSGDMFIIIRYFDEAGREVGTEQLTLSEEIPHIAEAKGRALTVSENSLGIDVEFFGGSLTIDRHTGNLISYIIGGKDCFVAEPARHEGKGMSTTVLRAPCDNDKNIAERWRKAGYFDARRTVTAFATLTTAESVEVTLKANYIYNDKVLFEAHDKYLITAGGAVTVESYILPTLKGLPDLPRFGKTLALSRAFFDITYYGRGGAECYPDFKAQSVMGVYKLNPKGYERYLRPQEAGCHTDVRYAQVLDKSGRGLLFVAEHLPFMFTARTASTEALMHATHPEDVKEDGKLHVYIDGFQNGIGSNSCGPGPLDAYRLTADKQYGFSFRIIPILKRK